MRVLMNATAAGPTGVRLLGQIYSVADAEGKELIEGGYATAVVEPGRETASLKPPEKAVVPPAPRKFAGARTSKKEKAR